MKLVIQRVTKAKVEINKKVEGQIEQGLVVLLGIGQGDNKEQIDFLKEKLCNLRIFRDEKDKMNLSIKDIKGQLLIISQFTLYADCRKGNRPSFVKAAPPKDAKELYEYFIEECKKDIEKVETGIFGADMEVSLVNDGPVTIILEK